MSYSKMMKQNNRLFSSFEPEKKKTMKIQLKKKRKMKNKLRHPKGIRYFVGREGGNCPHSVQSLRAWAFLRPQTLTGLAWMLL